MGLGSGLETVAGPWPTDPIVVVARSVQTTGFGLPVGSGAQGEQSGRRSREEKWRKTQRPDAGLRR